MSLEDEEALYYAEQYCEGEDEDATYGDLLAEYDGEYDDGQYVKVLDLIENTNKIFIEATFDQDLSLKLRHDSLVQVYENAHLYNHIYNKMVQKSDFLRLSVDNLLCYTTQQYNVGNMFKYSSLNIQHVKVTQNKDVLVQSVPKNVLEKHFGCVTLVHQTILPLT